MFINTYEVKDVFNKGWQKKVCLTGNKINSNIITEVQSLDKNTFSQDICDNYVKVISNQKKRKNSIGFIGALFVLMFPMWHTYSYKEYIIAKQDLYKVSNVGD
jgi:hypothetical protein